MTYNPTSDILGLEWPVTREGGTRLAATNDVAAAGFTSSSAQTVTDLRLYMSRVVGSPTFAVSVYAASVVPPTVSVDAFRPNEDVSVTSSSNVFARSSGVNDTSIGDFYTRIDESTLSTSDMIRFTNYPETYVGRLGTSAGLTPTTPVVSSVTLVSVVQVDAGSTNESVGFVQGFVLGGVEYEGDDVSVSKSDGQTTVRSEWATNPATGNAWTEAEIQLLDTTDEYLLRRSSTSDNGMTFDVFQTYLEVESTEAPAASGTVSPTADGWATVTLSANWSKANATSYVVSLRKTNNTGAAVWNLLDSGEACPHASHVSYRPTVDLDTGLISALGSSATGAHAFTMTVSGSPSTDSQPYATLTAEPVYTGRTVQQEFTPSATKTIGNIAGTIARQSATTDGDLTAKVKRRSDNVQIGGDVTFTTADVATSIRKLRRVVGAMASTGSASSGTQYYIEWSSTATSGSGWTVGVLDAEGSHGTATYGSTTNAATVAGAEDTTADVAAWTAVRAATVAGVAVSETGSGTTTAATVTWTASTETAFEAYEIYRHGTLVAELTTKATASWPDYEARVGVEESYTIRQRLTDGRVSAMSSAVTVTVADTTNRLVCNQDSTLNVGLEIEAPLGRSRNRDRFEYEPLGADHVRVHRGAQDRGFEMTLSVEQTSASDDGADLFADLLAACDADVDHLTIVTGWGDRYFVTADYEGDATAILGYGSASVRFREVTPAPVSG